MRKIEIKENRERRGNRKSAQRENSLSVNIWLIIFFQLLEHRKGCHP